MILLIQIIKYMSETLEYSDLEIDQAFTDIINGEYTVEDLMDVLNLESPSSTLLEAAQAKVSKWESAFFVALNRTICSTK